MISFLNTPHGIIEIRLISNRGEGEKAKSRSTVVNMYAKAVEEYVSVELSETPTISVFSLPSLVTATEAKDASAVQEKNAKYTQLIELHKNPDGFAARFTQTVNNPQKNQNEMTVANTLKDSGCQVASFDIIDANNQLHESDLADAELLGIFLVVQIEVEMISVAHMCCTHRWSVGRRG